MRDRRRLGVNRARVALVVLMTAAATVASPPALAATGDLTRVAGGSNGLSPGLATAKPIQPYGAAVNATTLFVSEDARDVVWAIDRATGFAQVIAGTGVGGYSGDGGAATSAQLHNPAGLAADELGNVYIADQRNHRVRRVDPSGMITTVAGNGTSGFSGDGGAATRAQISSPRGVALDRRGALFIADTSNNRIRTVNAVTGRITTVAGSELADVQAIEPTVDGAVAVARNSATGAAQRAGVYGDGLPATRALLNEPSDVAVTRHDEILIADTGSRRIRKVNAQGMITTVAGGGAPVENIDGLPAVAVALGSVDALSVDSRGVVYWVQGTCGNCRDPRVWRINTDGNVDRAIGNVREGYSGDGGPAKAARMYSPRDVAVADAQNYFVTDGIYTVRGVSAGIISTIAGNGTAGFGGDGGQATDALLSRVRDVAVTPAGEMYLSDTGNYDWGAQAYTARLRKVDATGTISTAAGTGVSGFSGDGGPATAAQVGDTLGGVVSDAAGNVYFSDVSNNRVRKIDTAGIITTVAGDGRGGNFPEPDGTPATASGLTRPYGLAIDGAGELYVGILYEVIRIDLAGRLWRVPGTQNRGDGSKYFRGIAVTPSGDTLYAAAPSEHRVYAIDTATGTASVIAGSGPGYGSLGAFGGDGGFATSARLYYPEDVAVDSAGNVFIADTYNARVRKVDAGGIITTVAGNGFWGYSGEPGPASAAGIANPDAVTVVGSDVLIAAPPIDGPGRGRVLRVEGLAA